MQWIISPPCSSQQALARQLGISPIIVQLLHNRGVIDPDAMRVFLNPEMNSLHAPEQMPGAAEAAEVLAAKIRDHKKIVIYGDYDVDGITGTAILWHLLKLAGADVAIYIPHRIEEGYGLNADALRQLRRDGADTVISVDCGITAVEEARAAREIGLTLIITDHHSLAASLPEAHVLVHPRVGSPYPNLDICGAGVAFKVAWALAQKLCGARKVSPEFREFLKTAVGLVALGTIADVVPLVGENRVFARFGLLGVADSKLTGLVALIESARLANQKLNSDHVGFWLAPRLNAAGRMGHALLAAELLTRADETRAKEIATYLESQNRSRQTMERKIFQEALQQIEAKNLASDARRAIVLAAEGWHAGVIGIVASRVVERFGRPTIMIALENGEGQGSGRSIRPFELNKAIADCGHHLLGHGGHAMAAGLRIKSGKVEAFTESFVERANQLLTAQDLEPTLRLDGQIGPEDLSAALVRDIERLGPFGTGNPRPKFASPVLRLEGEPRTVGKNADHLSFMLGDGRSRMKAIAFGQAGHLDTLRERRRCRVAYEPILNTFNGRTSVEMQVIDIDFA